jgi:hypothetical protein
MTYALVSVMLLVRILFIDTSLHQPVVMFTEFSFCLGTSDGTVMNNARELVGV